MQSGNESERYILHDFDLISFLIELSRCSVIVEGIKLKFCLCSFKNWNLDNLLKKSVLICDNHGEHLP